MAYIKYFQTNNTNDKNNISLRNVIFSVVTAYLLFAVFVTIISLFSVYGNLSIDTAEKITKILYYLTVLICGFISSYGKRKNGWLNGGSSALCYCFCMIITAFSVGSPHINIRLLINIIFSVILGIFGGIFGVNTQKKKKR